MKRSVPIGRPIANTHAYVMDKWLGLAAQGMIGELYVGGDGLARCYYNDPEMTAEKFIPHPYSGAGAERLYRTGDSVKYLQDGKIEFIGRADDQVKVRGYRIELAEIEAVLKGHASVRQSVVVAREDVGGSKRLLAYVVGEGDVTASSLKSYLRERLPEYMAPDAIILLEEMPVTANGKIDRERLPIVDGISRAPEQLDAPPWTPVEEIVVGIFEEILKLGGIGRYDNFFELGGHSLLATQVISRVRNMFGVELGVGSIFEDATARGLANRVEAAMKAGKTDQAPPLVRAEGKGSLPLSFAQQRLWFLDQLAPNNPFYNVPGAIRIEGRLDLEALERSANEIIRRHEVLRTRFEVEEGTPVQVINQWEPRRLELEDLTSLTSEEREQEVGRIAREEAGTLFDLSRGPLLRLKVLKLGVEEHVTLITMHHIVSDAWSMGILVREIGTLYQAYTAGEPSPLDELPLQYADFAVWQRAWLQGKALAAELDYWRKQLAGMEDLALPTDHPRPAAPSYRGASRQFMIDREVAQKLRALSQREGVTLFMALLGSFDVVMSRYSGQEDVALGTDIANRNRAEIEGVIGFFVNQLVMRVEVRGMESFSELLKRVREVCLGAYAHQDVPFEKLVEELDPERNLGRSPLFQAKLILQNAPRERLELEGLRLSSLGSELEAAKIDLTMEITGAGTEEGRGLLGAVTYSRDLFEEETIERLIGHYLNVLKGVVRGVDLEGLERPISELSMLGDQERAQILVEWNQTARPFSREWRIHELFEQQVKSTPEAVALIYEEGQLSYAELNAKSNQLAHYLKRLGVGPEKMVGVCLERSLEMVVGLLAILKAGGAYVPLDPAYPIERLTYMLEDSNPLAVLTQPLAHTQIPSSLFGSERAALDLERDAGLWTSESDLNPDRGPASLTPECLAYVIYTSGSTGRPKGVMNDNCGVVNQLLWMQEAYCLNQRDAVLQKTPFSFDVSVWEFFWPLLNGARLVMARPEGHKDPAYLADLIQQHGVTTLHFVPSMMQVFLEHEEAARCSSLTRVICSGEALPGSMARRFRERLSQTSLYNLYGPTEAAVDVTACVCTDAQQIASIGRPIANTQIYILDRSGQPVPVGVTGEIHIGGAQVARGYMGQSELTAERFVSDPFTEHPGARMYRTGDLARYLPGGEIEFLGRNDFQVKIRGFRIELGEIEAWLTDHPKVREAVVLAREDNHDDKRLVAYYTTAQTAEAEAPISAEELRAHLSAALPGYMAPASFVMLEALPLTPNGKLDRKALLSMELCHVEIENDYVGARTPIGEILCGIFEEALKIDRVGRTDNFFELGGHSLLATRVISRVRKTFGVEIEVRSIFEKATIEGLGRRIEEAMRAGEKDQAPPLIKVGRESQSGGSLLRLPLSFAQQRLWFIDQLDPGNAAYNIPSAVRMEGKFDLGALEFAINEIVRRHEVLRTKFEVVEDEPFQVIEKWEPRRLDVEDLTSLTREEKEEMATRLAREEAETGFDLRRGPLLRAKALKLEEEEHVLLFTMHHIVSDAWSMEILIREVGALYRAYLAGEAAPLEELPVQYVDFAVWQRERLRGEALEQELEYWRKQLAGVEPLKLPTDHPRPAVESYRGASQTFFLDADLATALRELGRQEGATLFMTLMAAFQTLLHRYTGQEDIAVGTPMANRERLELEGLIGYFVNTLVMRTKLSSDISFRELLHQVRDTALAAYSHAQAPFEKLVVELSPKRASGQNPLFQVWFFLENAVSSNDTVLPEINISFVKTDFSPAKLDLALTMTAYPNGIAGSFTYAADLFEPRSIITLANRFQSLLRALVRDPNRKLFDIPLMDLDGNRQLLETQLIGQSDEIRASFTF